MRPPLLIAWAALAASFWIRHPRAPEPAVAFRPRVEARTIAFVGAEAVASERRRVPAPAARPARAEIVWRVGRHLRLVYGAICAEQHAKAADLCEEILLVDPGYGFAGELLDLARKLPHMTVDRRNLVSWLELWDAATDPGAALLPGGFHALDSEAPRALLDTSPHLNPKGISGGSLYHEDYLEEAALYRRLEHEPFDLELADAGIDDVLDAVYDRVRLIIHLREAPAGSKRGSVRVRGLPLRQGLNAALEPFGLRVSVIDGALVAFGRN